MPAATAKAALMVIFLICAYSPIAEPTQPLNAQDRAQQIRNLSLWQQHWLTALAEHEEPWAWALSLHYSNTLVLNQNDFVGELRRETIDRILLHPSPAAEVLFWATLFCTTTDGVEDYCPVDELLDRLLEIDPNNLYTSLILFDARLAGKTGIRERTPDEWDWSHFDSWLENAVSLPRVENYDFHHFSQLVELFSVHGARYGIPSYLANAPLDWRAVIFASDRLVYPWNVIPSSLNEHCRFSAHQGRLEAQWNCRRLAERLLESSESTWARHSARELLANTYSNEPSAHLRKQLEAIAWSSQGPIPRCLKGYSRLQKPGWVELDSGLFVAAVASDGQIEALQELADTEGWLFVEDDYKQYRCLDIVDLPDEQLIEVLGPLAEYVTR